MLKSKRVHVRPAVLEADARADVDQREVVVEGVLADRREYPPGGDGAGNQQKPREGGETEVAEYPVVDPPADDEGLAPLGERHRVSGLWSHVLRLRADASGVGDLLAHLVRP